MAGKEKKIITKKISWAAWLAQMVEHATLHRKAVAASPMLGIEPTSKKKKNEI